MPKGKEDHTLIVDGIKDHIKKEAKKASKKAAKKKIRTAADFVTTEEQEDMLTLKQMAFAKYYVLNGGNAKQSAISAGYSEKAAAEVGYETLNLPHVKKVIKELANQKMSVDALTPEWKLDKLKAVAERLIELSLDEGAQNASSVSSALARIMQEINKMQGHYAPEKSMNLHAVAVFDDKLDEMIDEFKEEY